MNSWAQNTCWWVVAVAVVAAAAAALAVALFETGICFGSNIFGGVCAIESSHPIVVLFFVVVANYINEG